MVSKALVVGMYQRKLEELATQPDIDLTVAVPPFWREKGHDWRLERTFCAGYTLRVLPMRLNGHYHTHYYPKLGTLLDRVRPDLLHFDEEAYNLSTWLASRSAARRQVPMIFFSWQNIMRTYPPPFSWLERSVFQHAALGIAGNQDAAEILRRKGYRRSINVIPQFGIDPELFAPRSPQANTNQLFTIGFVGRLIPAKGLELLLKSLARLDGAWRLVVVGSGPSRPIAGELARTLKIEDRVDFRGQVASTEMPAVMRELDVLAGPSLTTDSWKEQFGRMLVEAMASEVPVVGSDSGEIPRVIGDGGIVVPEADTDALYEAIKRLRDDAALRQRLGRAGRQRVLANYTQAAIASQTAAAYRIALKGHP